jgi:hypothetical protein
LDSWCLWRLRHADVTIHSSFVAKSFKRFYCFSTIVSCISCCCCRPPNPHWRKSNMTSSHNNVCKLSSSCSLCELEDGKLYGMMQEKMALRSLQVWSKHAMSEDWLLTRKSMLVLVFFFLYLFFANRPVFNLFCPL